MRANKGSSPADTDRRSNPAPQAQADRQLPARLTRSQVKNTLRSHQPDINACLGQEWSAGSIVVGFVVQPDGTVTDAELQGDKHTGAPAAQCVIDVVEELEFSRTQTEMPITNPFRYLAE